MEPNAGATTPVFRTHVDLSAWSSLRDEEAKRRQDETNKRKQVIIDAFNDIVPLADGVYDETDKSITLSGLTFSILPTNEENPYPVCTVCVKGHKAYIVKSLSDIGRYVLDYENGLLSTHIR